MICIVFCPDKLASDVVDSDLVQIIVHGPEGSAGTALDNTTRSYGGQFSVDDKITVYFWTSPFFLQQSSASPAWIHKDGSHINIGKSMNNEQGKLSTKGHSVEI